MGKLIDLTGQRFGRLTVLKRHSENIDNRPAWLCQCDCGNTKIVSGHSLREHYTKSCGCLNREIASQRMEKPFVIGEKIGSWTILKKDLNIHHSYTYWICKCDCGTIKSVSSHSLRTGESKSCGLCLRKLCIGQKFNELTITDIDLNKTNNKHLFVKCKCTCGKECSVRYSDLRHGHPISCGCKTVQSHGVQKIKQILIDNNIPFVQEKTFDSCRFPDTKALAFFDFYIDNSYIIEFDGKQHFYETNYFSQTLSEIQEHDAYKNNWCKINNIPLIRISYKDQDNISLDDLLLESTAFLV